MQLVIDESFVDFAEDNADLQNTVLTEEVLAKYEQLYVVKSISKSYGVPGLRLGVLASSNQEMIAKLKKDVAIWNINSFGEFYMQIVEKYKKDYAKSLEEIRMARDFFMKELGEIPFIKVFPSQANYVMCELIDGFESRKVAENLLEQNILSKDLTSKIGNGKQYIRLAVRTVEENRYLVNELRKMQQ